MLTFESPFYEVDGVIVFRDHASPTTFHYLGGPPRLTRTSPGNVPNLLLLKYRHALEASASTTAATRDQLGGGFLMFGVDCGLSDTKKQEIANTISAKVGGEVELVPVLFTKGKVSVIALDAQPAIAADPADSASTSKFVRGVIGTATPSLLGDQRAIFSLSLSPDAVTLIEDAYQSQLSPIGVIYELEFTGLRPAVSIKATIDKKRVYEFFKAGLHLGVHAGGGSTGTPATNPTTGNPNPAQPRPGDATRPAAGPPAPPPPPPPPPPPGQAGPPSPAAPPSPPTPPGPARRAEPPTPPGPTPPTPPGPTPPSPTPPGPTPPTPTPPGPTPPNPTPPNPTPPNPSGRGQPQTPPMPPNPGGAAPPQAPPRPANPTGGGQTPPNPVNPSGGGQNPPNPTGSGQGASSGRAFALDADLSYSVTQLEQTGAITIEVVQQQMGESIDRQRDAAIQLMKETLIQEFFRPSMTNVSSAAADAQQLMASTANTGRGSAGGDAKVQLGFQLQYKKEEELTTATFDYSSISPEVRTHAPNGFFSALLTDTQREKLIREVDLDDEFFKVLGVDISTAADYDELDVELIKVRVKYGSVAEEYHFSKADNAPKHFQAFVQGGEYAYQYQVEYLFGQSPDIGAQKQSYVGEWQTTTDRAIVVHPPDDVSMLRVILEPGIVDWELVDKIEATFSYDDAPNQFHSERTYLIASDTVAQNWTVRLTDPTAATYTLQPTFHMKDQREIEGAAVVERRPHVPIKDPFAPLPIKIQARVNPNDIVRVDVDITYSDKANDLEVRRSVQLVPPFEPKDVILPLINERKRTYKYRATLIETSGAVETQPEVETDRNSIQITEGGIVLDLVVTVLGDMTQQQIEAIQLEFRSEPLPGAVQQPTSVLLQPGGQAQQTVPLVLRADRTTFEFRTKTFLTGRPPVESKWKQQSDPNVVIQPSQLVTP